jgi:hypothetical protein
MSLFGTFERALIWQGTREMFYQARRRERRAARPGPPRNPATFAVAGDDAIIIWFICQQGHQHQVTTTLAILNAQSDRVLGREKCPTCHGICRWQTLDHHLVNPA